MSELLPTTNADGLPVVPMTEEQKYLFDLRGWMCLPGLIEGDQLAEIQEHQMKFVKDPESLPPDERNSVGGPSQVLLDHPVIVGILNEDHQRLSLFNLYNTVNSKWGLNSVPDEVIAAMPPKRQTLFRGVWVGAGKVMRDNKYFDEENVAV